jgi:hypothetical protein
VREPHAQDADVRVPVRLPRLLNGGRAGTGDLPSVRFGCRLYVPTARFLELLGLVPEDR